ncbi:MAG: hypothetical protein H8E12_14710 [Rhodobacteraceae bacterium]|nr:hypothetical protein [Paracoccaceae bacterium]
MVALALIPLLQQLTIVREDMKSSLGLSDSSAASAAHGISAYKKLYWGGLLENVKIGLKTFTTGVTIPGMGEMNFFDDTNAESVEEK